MKALLTTVIASTAINGHAAIADTIAYGAFLHDTIAPNALFLVGEISPSESFELRRAMRDHAIQLVVTASPGGNLYEGLQIAAIIQDNGIGTFVPATASCESSCANVFLGGKNRLVEGELGVHQFFSGSETANEAAPQSVTTAVAQYTTADIIGIMNEFSTPAFVYEKMFGSSEIYYFRESEKNELNLDVFNADFLAYVDNARKAIQSSPELLIRPHTNSVSSSNLISEPVLTPQLPAQPEQEEAAIRFIASYMAEWSLPNEVALSRISNYYADKVNFYGNQLTQIEVLQEKLTFADRWPLRNYEVDPSTLRVSCSNGRCDIQSVIFWSATSPERGKEASGMSTWNVILEDIGAGYRVVSESGETIKRN